MNILLVLFLKTELVLKYGKKPPPHFFTMSLILSFDRFILILKIIFYYFDKLLFCLNTPPGVDEP